MTMPLCRLHLLAVLAFVLAMLTACANPSNTPPPGATQSQNSTLAPTASRPALPPVTPAAAAFSSAQLSWRISAPNDLFELGKEFSLTLDLDPRNKGLSGIQFKLNYPVEAIELVDITPGGILGPSPLVVNQPGRQAVFAMARRGDTVAATGPGRVAVIKMRTIKDLPKTGSVMIWLDRVKLTDGDFQTIGQDSVAWSLSGPG